MVEKAVKVRTRISALGIFMKRISIPKISKPNSIKQTLQSGFTLIEVLIAVAIAALTITVATIALGDNELAKLKNKSRQL